MEQFKFKYSYSEVWLRIACMCILLFVLGFLYIINSPGFLLAICIPVVPIIFLCATNITGIGVLYDDYAEIQLRYKKYRIKYTEINKIRKKTTWWPSAKAEEYWLITLHNESTIKIFHVKNFRKNINVPLENFMMNLRERAKL